MMRYTLSCLPWINSLSDRGQIWAFGVSSNVPSPIVKNRDSRLANCALVIRRSPVAESRTAPVALT